MSKVKLLLLSISASQNFAAMPPVAPIQPRSMHDKMVGAVALSTAATSLACGCKMIMNSVERYPENVGCSFPADPWRLGATVCFMLGIGAGAVTVHYCCDRIESSESYQECCCGHNHSHRD